MAASLSLSLPPSSQLRLKICKFEMGPPACPPKRQKQFKVEEELPRLYVLHNKQRRQVEIIICELRRRGSREVGVSRNSCPLKARHLRLWTDYSHAFPWKHVAFNKHPPVHWSSNSISIFVLPNICDKFLEFVPSKSLFVSETKMEMELNDQWTRGWS